MFDHGGNPILRWMFDNVSLAESPDGWRKPVKAGAQGKIDGVMGCIYSLGRLMASKPKKKKISMPIHIEVKK
jgi:phage terminase large subunit-like protein